MNDLPCRPNRITTASQYPRPGYGSARDRDSRSQYGDRYGLHRPAGLLRYDEEPYARAASEYQRQSRQTSKYTFDQAATRLHGVLNLAVDFYENFHGEFERQVKGIRAYASPELISAIWVAKIDPYRKGERRAPRFVRRSDEFSNDDYEDNRVRVQNQTSFRDIVSNLENTLREAMEAVPYRGQQPAPSSDDIETTKLVMEKLRMAYWNIHDLLCSAMKRPEKMQAVVREIRSTLRVMEENSETWDPRGRRNIVERRYNVDDRSSVGNDREGTSQGMDNVDDHSGQGNDWNNNGQGNGWND